MIIIVMIMIIIMIFIIIIVIITQPLVGTFGGQGKPASMIYMNGNVRLTITITDALSAYSNHSASAMATAGARVSISPTSQTPTA